jgi:hypothetical protein
MSRRLPTNLDEQLLADIGLKWVADCGRRVHDYQIYLTNERKLATGSILIAIAVLRFLY